MDAEEPEEVEQANLAIFPPLDIDTWREARFQLGYTQHGGSGLGWHPSEIDDLELEDIWWFLERLGQQREAEAREMEKAARKKK